MNLPKRIVQQQHEAESYAILLYNLRKIGIFRNVTENDYGIDFEIEFVKNNCLTGKYIKVQVKSARNLKIRSKDNVPTVSGIKQSTLLYWAELSFSTNVLAFAVDLQTEKIYLTKPIFWQAIKLLDKGEKTKTIEFLPFSDEEAGIIEKLTLIFGMYAPTIRDYIYFHTDAIRHLQDFFQLYSDVFQYDGHVPVNEPHIFRHFLDICRKLLWNKSIAQKFPKEDQDKWFSYGHWERKTDCELCNHICCEPLSILFPEILSELERLRELVLSTAYYWSNKNLPYLRLVYSNEIPNCKKHEEIAAINYEYGNDYLKNDLETDAYLVNLIKANSLE